MTPAIVRALVGGQDADTPTATQFGAYRAMFDHFNRELFAGTLPEPILNFSRASKGTLAFFAPNRWEGSEASVRTRSVSIRRTSARAPPTRRHRASSTRWRTCGSKSTASPAAVATYHNIEWSRKMLEIGLQPIDAKTGQPVMSAHGMSHRFIEGGPFSRAFTTLPAQALLPWSHVGAVPAEAQGDPGVPGDTDEPRRNKVKYTCAACGANAWGKPGLVILCLGGVETHDPELLEVPR